MEAQIALKALKYLNLEERSGNFARTVFPFNFLVLPVFYQLSSMNPLSEEYKLCLFRKCSPCPIFLKQSKRNLDLFTPWGAYKFLLTGQMIFYMIT